MRPHVISGLAAAAVLLCAVALHPVWATNDDVALAMLGSGFGIANAPSAYLIFAHPLYGLALNVLTPVLGTAAHGWLTLAGLMLAAATLALALAPMRCGVTVLAACWLALLLPATLSPQFTITSALLFAAGAAWFLAEASGRIGQAMAIAALVFGFILRAQSFELGLLLLLPVLLLRRPWRAGPARRFLAICIVIVAAGTATDWLCLHAQPGWQHALEANLLRAVFTDLHRVPWLPDNPAYQAAGWTRLDYDMFMNWYPYGDVFAPDRLTRLIRAVAIPALSVPADAWASWFLMPWGWTTLTLTLALATTCALGLAIRPFWQTLAWALPSVVCLGGLGWSGRTPLDRVWFAVLCVVGCGAAVLAVRGAAGVARRAAIVLALLLSAATAEHALAAHEALLAGAQAYRAWLAEHPFPRDRPVVVWGDALKYEWAVPVLRPHNPFPPAGIIGIGALSESPVQRAVWARLGITDVSAWLCRGPGTTLLARPSQVALLRRFCEQRMGAAPSARLVAEDAGTGVYELASAKKP